MFCNCVKGLSKICRAKSRVFETIVIILAAVLFVSGPLFAGKGKVNPHTAKARWSGHVIDFPEITTDGQGNVWMATIERPTKDKFIGIYKIEGEKQELHCILKPEKMTGMTRPAIAPLDDGCVVAFGIEVKDKWQICYAFVKGDDVKRQSVRRIEFEGPSNISPAVAVVGGKAYIVWESNAGGRRAIYSCVVDEKSQGDVKRISSDKYNSYNPSIVALEDGSMFAAWDSVRGQSADIYGAWFKKGWQLEKRITSDARIERHPHLASYKDQLWMAWQAQSYTKLRVNNSTKQKIAVAKIEGGKLLAPKDLFEKISKKKDYLVRPRIGFDSNGTLYLTARDCIGVHGGWQPVVWTYSGQSWSEKRELLDVQGRWHPVSFTFGKDGFVGAVQHDDIPTDWNMDYGEHAGWNSDVAVKTLAMPKHSKLVLEELAMPATNFSLVKKQRICNAGLERQAWKHDDNDMKLFFGTLHDHTDLSVCNRRYNVPGHDLFANVRDIELLDFVALTDHGYNFDQPQWDYNAEQTRANHDEGMLLTFLGQEWTSGDIVPAAKDAKVKMNRYGHHNLIYLEPYQDKFYDSMDGDISPTQLWQQLEGTEFVCIPHQLADWAGKGKYNPPIDWTEHDEHFQPVAEIFQNRQSYEYLGAPRQARDATPFKGHFMQDAWEMGVVIGVIASPDRGGGDGKAGVWSEEFTRESIFRAIQKRHTFGTSGAKMALKFWADEAMMGDKVKHPQKSIRFGVEGLAKSAIKEVVIFRNNKVVFRSEPGKKEFKVTWTDESPPNERLWYYARIHAEDNELAWSSPIWFVE
ncbi:MAG: DUF3604 domain-containing protein [Planctomycetes bacterium]|nr:DUF3604 domain-containing protein [Planctomycetota bacterium]